MCSIVHFLTTLCTYLKPLFHFLVTKFIDSCFLSCLSGRGRGRDTGRRLDGRGKKEQVNPFKMTQIQLKYSVLAHRQDKGTNVRMSL